MYNNIFAINNFVKACMGSKTEGAKSIPNHYRITIFFLHLFLLISIGILNINTDDGFL